MKKNTKKATSSSKDTGKQKKSSTVRAHVIVLGNEKGGSGKSTLAMHLLVGFLSKGKRVASIDCDSRQGSLTRYILNRNKLNKKIDGKYPLPDHFPMDPLGIDLPEESVLQKHKEKLVLLIEAAMHNHDIVVIDTPGAANPISLLAHSFADTLITPINDSFVDLDVIAHIDGHDMSIKGPSHYSELVWDARKLKTERDQVPIDWILVRNRLSNLDAFNKRDIAKLLSDLSKRMQFRTVSGLSERVIFRELFLLGLTILDLREASANKRLSPSHLAAREEVQEIIEAIDVKTDNRTRKAK